MTPIILRYAEDRTGESPNNRVVNETHQTVNRRVRAIAPYHGPFYSESLVVRNAVTNDVLIKDVDYHAVEYYESISRLTGKEVCAVILIVNEGITHQEFSIDYQVVGGEFSYGYDSIAKMMDKINNDDRPVHWGNLLNLPPEFIPSAHLHDIGDTFGWEYVVAELELIRKAILMGDSASHDEIYMYVDRRVEELRGESDQLEAKVDAHTVNYNNPHNVTKAQVGLGIVENYRPSTKAEAEAGSLNNVYMTALRVKEAITFQAVTPLTNLLNAHTSRTDNPHSVTKAQTGLGSVQNFGLATKVEAEAGTSNVKYMTPLRTREAVLVHEARKDNPHIVTKAQVGLGLVENYRPSTKSEAEAGSLNNVYMTPLRTREAVLVHETRKDNPHSVTKAQVGLGSVENYDIATVAEARAGTSNTKYMTPTRTRDAVLVHEARKDNPHSVTKAQVGLGLVENFPIASSDEARSGTSNEVYMTPLRTKDAVDVHATLTNNPHNVTKAQVGLGSVLNYGVASKAQAEAGTATNLYMTPLRVKEAITAQAGTRLDAHMADASNPHNVTKAQVGLGSVENYGIATQTEAQTATSNAKYMTPLRTSQAITTLAIAPLNTHINNKSNPHAVTKAQVGLGSVENYSVATQAEAQAGTSNAKYMTPLRAKQTVDRFAYTVDSGLSTENINTLNTRGIYGQPASANATTARGYPVETAGTLFVTNSAYGCQQMYIPYNTGDIWHRGLTGNWNGSGPWRGWKRINEWGNVHGKPTTFPPTTHNHNGVHVIQTGGNQNVQLRIISGQLQAYVGSSWQVVWPPQWQ